MPLASFVARRRARLLSLLSHAALFATLALPLAVHACPGDTGSGSTCGGSDVASQGNTSNTQQGAGNPINVITGNKFQREVDLSALPGVLGLEIVRYYNSSLSLPSSVPGILGRGWRLSYDTELNVQGTTLEILEADGTRLSFHRDLMQPDAGRVRYRAASPLNGQVWATKTSQGTEYTWRWQNGRQLSFNAMGKLVQIAAPTGEFVTLQRDVRGWLMEVTDPQGRRLHLHYLDKANAAADSQRFRGVQSIDSPVGRFTYSYGNPVPKGSRVLPSQLAANLVKVSIPTHYDADQPVHAWTERGVSSSSIARLYHYENASYPTLLTGISVLGQGSDGKLMNQRLVTWGYDSQGRANLSVKGEPARYETGKDGKELTPRKLVAGTGIEQVTLAWPKPGMTVLTNSLGQQTTYKTATIADESRILEVRGAGCASCGPSNIRYGYDSLGRLIEETQLSVDGVPQKTTRTERDGLGRPIKISTVAYANGKPQAAQLVVRYAYGNIDTDAPNLIVRPSVVPGKEYQIRIAYNDHGQPVRVTESGFSPALDGSAVLIERTTSYKYQSVNGRSVLAEIDGPLQNGPNDSPADSDITRYTWDSRGNAVQGIAYPMGLVARFEYDQKGINPTGRLIKTTGVDGIATELKYSPNGTVEQVNRAGAITRYSQDALGRTVQALDPVGQRLQFSYDNAGGITSIFDQQNNRIQLLRDTEGELMQARLLNPDGSLSQQGVDYRQPLPDAQGRQSPVSEPAGPSRDAVLAAVRQLIASARMADSTNIARPDLAASPYAALQEFMAAADRPDAKERSAISTARDSQGRLTTYLHDDFNRLILAQSPTTGSTSYRYNLADQIVARISQDGSRAEYVRDAAGRVVAVKAYNAQNRLDEDATIAWGKAHKPERIKYMAGEEQFAYDEAGRLIAHIQIIDGKRFTLRYRYNSAGQLLAKTLPEGQTLSYRYRGTVHPRAGLLESVWLNGFDNATGNALTSGLLDRPIVQGMNDENERYTRRGFTFGNGLTSQLTLDAHGRILSAGNAQVGQTQLAYGGGQAAQPASLQDDEALTVQTRRAQSLGQPAEREAAQALMSRLWGAMTSWRASPADALLETTPGILDMGQAEVRFDERGRQTAQGRARFVYDSLNRLIEVRQATGGMDPSGKAIEQPVAQYRYNLFGQRIAKLVHRGVGRAATGGKGKVTYYFYDGSHLAMEADDSGAIGSQYVWLDDKPVALLRQGHVFAIHTDHRQVPLAVTDEARTVVWQAAVADFGHAAPAQGQALGYIEFNLRGSNQYCDAETGLHYNTHRYYDPVAARYLTPDPMGLAAGPDLHAFALNRPHQFSDPLGLAPVSNRDGSLTGWTYEDKLSEIIKRAAPLLPGEIGNALLEMVQPANLAVMGAIFTVWAGSQFTPAGWVADLALLGTGIWYAGSGVIDLLKTFVALHQDTKNAKCEGDLNAAAKRLANGFVTGSGELAGGLSGTWGMAKSGGITRIAEGIRTVIDFGKRQIRKPAIPPTSTITRPSTSNVKYGPDSKYQKPDGSWDWPPNDGFAGPRVKGMLPKDTLIDRFGSEYGSFVSPEGTPFEMRALAPSSLNEPYYVYRIKKPLPVESGKIAPAFDQPGGGTQYVINWAEIAKMEGISEKSIPKEKIKWLVDIGYLDRIGVIPK